MTGPLLWPDYATPAALAAVEAVPLQARGLPESTYALLSRAATHWPDRTALTVLPDTARWREPLHRTFAEFLADVHRVANLLHDLGVRRGDAVAPDVAQLRRAASPQHWPRSSPASRRRWAAAWRCSTSPNSSGAPALACWSPPDPN